MSQLARSCPRGLPPAPHGHLARHRAGCGPHRSGAGCLGRRVPAGRNLRLVGNNTPQALLVTKTSTHLFQSIQS